MFAAASPRRREEQEGETERCEVEQLPRAGASLFSGNNRKLNGLVGDIRRPLAAERVAADDEATTFLQLLTVPQRVSRTRVEEHSPGIGVCVRRGYRLYTRSSALIILLSSIQKPPGTNEKQYQHLLWLLRRLSLFSDFSLALA